MVSFNVNRSSDFLLHFLCAIFINHKLLILCCMNEASLAIYLGNIATFILMLYLTFLNPSLLNNQYWVYILTGLFTAIVFHTGHEAGKSK